MRFETAGIFTISILNYYYNRLHIWNNFMNFSQNI
jgi:hypothetical protein